MIGGKEPGGGFRGPAFDQASGYGSQAQVNPTDLAATSSTTSTMLAASPTRRTPTTAHALDGRRRSAARRRAARLQRAGIRPRPRPHRRSDLDPQPGGRQQRLGTPLPREVGDSATFYLDSLLRLGWAIDTTRRRTPSTRRSEASCSPFRRPSSPPRARHRRPTASRREAGRREAQGRHVARGRRTPLRQGTVPGVTLAGADVFAVPARTSAELQPRPC